jgi:ABC-type oligopeptide transport system ATPase subunit
VYTLLERRYEQRNPGRTSLKTTGRSRTPQGAFPDSAWLLRRQVGAVRAVDDVSFTVYEGETLGLVGESGCGKSTTGLAILKLLEATAGQVRFRGEEVTQRSEAQMRPLRRHMMMVFRTRTPRSTRA